MKNDETVPSQPPQTVTKAQNRFALILTVVLLTVVIGGGIYLRKHSRQGASGTSMQTGTGAGTSGPVVQKKVNDLTVTIKMPAGLRLAQNNLLIEFRKGDALLDVGDVKFSLDMNMSGMTMHDAAKVVPAGTPGQYRATIKPEMGGDWVASIEYSGPQGLGRTSFAVSVKQ